ALSFGMADSDCRIGVEQHHRNWFAKDRTAAYHDSVLAFHIDVIVLKQPHYAGGRSGPRRRLLYRPIAETKDARAINHLFEGDSIKAFTFVNLGWDGML